MAAVAVAQSESLTISRSESQAIVTVLLVTTAVTTFCAVATTVPIAVLDPLLSSTESRRGPAYDLPVAKPVAKDEVVQVAVPVYDHYAFQQLETAARTQDFVYHKAASALLCRNQISRRFSRHSDSHRSLPPNGPIHWHLTLAGNQSPVKHNRTAELQQNKTDNRTAGLQQNKTAPPATSGRSVDDLFVIAYQIYALALGLLIAYLISTAV